MWKQIDPKGAMVGAAIFACLMLVAGLFFAIQNVSIRLSLPPAKIVTKTYTLPPAAAPQR